jgi:alkylmercury lyase-like protein
MPRVQRSDADIDAPLRLYIYRHFIEQGRAPLVATMAIALGASTRAVRAGLRRLGQTHAFVVQDNGELWRAAPFSAVPTAFPVQIGRRRWWANCIWDALGIPAMLRRDGRIEASCGCCNHAMSLNVTDGKLLAPPGIIHIAVPARHWYDDVVFT